MAGAGSSGPVTEWPEPTDRVESSVLSILSRLAYPVLLRLVGCVDSDILTPCDASVVIDGASESVQRPADEQRARPANHAPVRHWSVVRLTVKARPAKE